MNILYTIFIFPVEQLITLAYVFAFRVFDNPALSVLGVSLAVSIFTLPLYFMAETLQRSERDIQKRMKPEVDNIKAVFSGDERFMRLATYYRQNNYHPFYSLRSSISILIQIPFFIAAYHFLSNATVLADVSFGPIKDLTKPDSLLIIHGTAFNILPVIMTLVNCASSTIYVKGFSLREKVQLYGMAGIFLLLLYNSPSALVLYWTGNNLFSLVKNVIQKVKNPGKVIVVLLAVFSFFSDIFLLFFHGGALVKRVFLAVVFSALPFFTILFAKNRQITVVSRSDQKDKADSKLFVLSALVLFLLGGLVIPSSLIRTSVVEFSFIENFDSPFHFIVTALLQSIGIFLVWPLCIYFMSSRKTRKILVTVFAPLAFTAVVNAFLFPGNYGFLTGLFTFSETVAPGRAAIFGNLFLIVFISALVLLLLRRLKKIALSILKVSVCALVLAGIINSAGIFREFQKLRGQFEDNKITVSEPVYKFSKTGKNVVVIMLDRAMAGYVPYIFEEKPELYGSLDGFTLYKNTVSFGRYTNVCSPALFGGYEYAPLEIQARKDIPLVKKQNEALLLLPRIFLDHNFRVTVTDPPYANYQWPSDLSIFDNYPEIDARNLVGNYDKDWLSNKSIMSNSSQLIENLLIRFSFFKFMPLILRNFVYDNGHWLTVNVNHQLLDSTLKNYAVLDVLPLITKVDSEPYNTYNVICNDLTHQPSFLQPPDYTPSMDVTDLGSGPFAGEAHYHVNMAALLLLGKWFDFLKENGVYDNTRMIVVSDHGRDLNSKFPDNIILPDKESVQYHNPLFLVKDFESHGLLKIDNSFMTNADVPLIALEGLVENPVNPWTGNRLTSNKENGVIVTTSTLFDVSSHPGNTFDIKPDEWLHVRDNIFDPKNWSFVTK